MHSLTGELPGTCYKAELWHTDSTLIVLFQQQI